MISKDNGNKGQLQVISIDQLVPEDHLLRQIDKYVDFNFIYDLVEDKYCKDNGRPVLILLHLSKYLSFNLCLELKV